MLTGMTIGFVFCWQQSLLMIVIAPFMIVSTAIQAKFQSGLSESSNQFTKEADILCGDAVMNFKTVQSFGYEHLIV
jgi:ABC-type transport system involved in Fe-S cluster assembly fused permease/ATPase subunit